MIQKKFFVHETAIIDDNVEVGKGSKIWHFSHIQSGSKIGEECSFGQNVNVGNNVTIGNHVKVQNNVSIYEGVELEDYVFCGPSMVFTNVLFPRSEFPQMIHQNTKTLVKKSQYWSKCNLVCGNTIGKYSLIGAGSVITKNVPNYAMVVGNPGKILGWVDNHGMRLKFDIKGKSKCGKFFFDGKIVKSVD